LIGVQKGINIAEPTQLRKNINGKPKLDPYQAHFIYNAMKYHNFFLEHKGKYLFDYIATVLLHFLVIDSQKLIDASPYDNPIFSVEYDDQNNPSITYEKISKAIKDNFSLIAEFASMIRPKLYGIYDCFEQSGYSTFYMFPSETGKKRIKEEQPNVYEKLKAIDSKQGLRE